jgi:lipid-A-disaccharide synthase
MDDIRREVNMQSQDSSLDVRLFHGCTYDLIRASDVALAKPGTITLELALLGTPTVVAAKAHSFTAFALKHLKRIPSLSLPNLVAGEPIVPEFLQKEARADKISVALLKLIEGPARESQKASFVKLAQSLGKGGASSNAAAVAAEMIDGTARA